MTRREFLRLALGTAVGLSIPRVVSAGGQSAPPPAPAADEAGCGGWGIPWEIAPSKGERVFVPLVVGD